jgi:hypothetical protein
VQRDGPGREQLLEADPRTEVVVCICPGIDDLFPPGPAPVAPEGGADESGAVLPDAPVEAPAEGRDASAGYWSG